MIKIVVGYPGHDGKAAELAAEGEEPWHAQQQENDALAQDIAEGTTTEKMLDMAREELGYVNPNEIVIYDVSN